MDKNLILSIIIPAYNEEYRIIPTLEEYFDFFRKKFGSRFEIIIVVNNSNDNTFLRVKNFSKGRKEIKVINIGQCFGKGDAVLQGFKIAKGDLIGFSDADGSVDSESFYKLCKLIENYDGVIASRKIKGAKVYGRSFFQKVSSLMFNIFVRLLFKLNYKDTQCGGKLFSKKVVTVLLREVNQKGWIFDVDILNVCRLHKFKIFEIPIIWRDKQGSKLSFKGQITSLYQLIRYWLK